MGGQYSPREVRSYNDDNTLASISYSGAAIGDLGYSWDANKNKTSESIGGVMSGYGFTADYDAEDRLTSWDRADASLDQSWELSPVGDWNSITENAAVQNRTHGPVHEILTAGGQVVQHDAKGNMTSIPSSLRPTASPLALKWDFDNKLRTADTDNDGIDNVFYRWDALGRRVGRDDGTNHMIYFQDGQQTLADYPAGGAASSPAYTYVYGSYIDEVILRNEGGGTRYYHRNQQYSIIALTDVGGAIVERYAYTAYGQLSIFDPSGSPLASSNSNNRYTYTGREWDGGLSLYHYRARMYAPVAGRFVSRDRTRYESGLLLYQYVAGNPIVNIDPLGERETNATPGAGGISPCGLRFSHLLPDPAGFPNVPNDFNNFAKCVANAVASGSSVTQAMRNCSSQIAVGNIDTLKAMNTEWLVSSACCEAHKTRTPGGADPCNYGTPTGKPPGTPPDPATMFCPRTPKVNEPEHCADCCDFIACKNGLKAFLGMGPGFWETVRGNAFDHQKCKLDCTKAGNKP